MQLPQAQALRPQPPEGSLASSHHVEGGHAPGVGGQLGGDVDVVADPI